jgi:hypothetical protein
MHGSPYDGAVTGQAGIGGLIGGGSTLGGLVVVPTGVVNVDPPVDCSAPKPPLSI